jgi:sugar lactone lactonase YvrE
MKSQIGPIMVLRILVGGLVALASASSGYGATVSTLVTNGLVEPRCAVVGNADGDLFITDYSNHRIVKYAVQSGLVTTLAGRLGISGTNDGTGFRALFNAPYGILWDTNRQGLVVSDSGNHAIRFVGFDGSVSNLAGHMSIPGVVSAGVVAGSAAYFNTPAGMASDANGNIYIADSRNNAIRILNLTNGVETIPGPSSGIGLYAPVGLAVDLNNVLYVCDTRNHVIRKRGTNGVWSVIAGTLANPPNVGFADGLPADFSSFNHPRGIIAVGGDLYVSDSENHAIRKISVEAGSGELEVSTYVGLSGTAGQIDGDAAVAKLNTPVGLIYDPIDRAILFVDSKGPDVAKGSVRIIRFNPLPPPLDPPSIGRLELVVTTGGTELRHTELENGQVFNDIPVFSFQGVQGVTVFYNSQEPSTDDPDFSSVPDPGSGADYVTIDRWSPFNYKEAKGDSIKPKSLLVIKAQSRIDRRFSPVATKAINFRVSQPELVSSNSASYKLKSSTPDVTYYFTTNSTLPATTNYSISIKTVSTSPCTMNLGYPETPLTVIGVAMRDGFKQSGYWTNVFTSDSYRPHQISIGLNDPDAEGATHFKAYPGGNFYLPIVLKENPDLSLVAYTFQFNTIVSNFLAMPLPPGSLSFTSMLVRPLGNSLYEPIPAAVSTAYTNFLDFQNTNNLAQLIGITWLTRFAAGDLYPSLSQNLISFSRARDRVFDASADSVILGAVRVEIPANSTNGSVYQAKITAASGTTDGISQPVDLFLPTRGSTGTGSLNTVKNIDVYTNLSLLVGDVAPFRWYNVSDFGDGNLVNNDVVQTFEEGIYSSGLAANLRTAVPADSALFEAMDSCCYSTNGADMTSVALFSGSDTTINSIGRGDGQIDIYDVWVTSRRSLDPFLTWFTRKFTPTGIVASPASNPIPKSKLPVTAKSGAAPVEIAGQPHHIRFSAADQDVAAGQVVDVPINVSISGISHVQMLMLSVRLMPLAGAPLITNGVSFIPAAGLGAPTLSSSKGGNNVQLGWLGTSSAGVRGDDLVGTVRFQVPAGFGSKAAYLVVIGNASAAGFRTRDEVETSSALLKSGDWSGSSYGDAIPDHWRLRYFGSVSNLLSQAEADADGDGISNLREFLAGTDPANAGSRLALRSPGRTGQRLTLRWPGIAGKRYLLEASPVLGGTNWMVLTNSLTPNGGTVEYSEDGTASGSRFFRVRVAP